MTMLIAGANIDFAGALSHFAEHGYARLGRLMNDDALSALRARADEIMLGQVTYPGLFF